MELVRPVYLEVMLEMSNITGLSANTFRTLEAYGYKLQDVDPSPNDGTTLLCFRGSKPFMPKDMPPIKKAAQVIKKAVPEIYKVYVIRKKGVKHV